MGRAHYRVVKSVSFQVLLFIVHGPGLLVYASLLYLGKFFYKIIFYMIVCDKHAQAAV
jgi:hypothetical protein